jgi:hypothetical protein
MSTDPPSPYGAACAASLNTTLEMERPRSVVAEPIGREALLRDGSRPPAAGVSRLVVVFFPLSGTEVQHV